MTSHAWSRSRQWQILLNNLPGRTRINHNRCLNISLTGGRNRRAGSSKKEIASALWDLSKSLRRSSPRLLMYMRLASWLRRRARRSRSGSHRSSDASTSGIVSVQTCPRQTTPISTFRYSGTIESQQCMTMSSRPRSSARAFTRQGTAMSSSMTRVMFSRARLDIMLRVVHTVVDHWFAEICCRILHRNKCPHVGVSAMGHVHREKRNGFVALFPN